jgi:hypothetical protein
MAAMAKNFQVGERFCLKKTQFQYFLFKQSRLWTRRGQGQIWKGPPSLSDYNEGVFGRWKWQHQGREHDSGRVDKITYRSMADEGGRWIRKILPC